VNFSSVSQCGRLTDLNVYSGFPQYFTKAAKSVIWQTPCSVSTVSEHHRNFRGWQDKISMSHWTTPNFYE
jgi:hypothetical protein